MDNAFIEWLCRSEKYERTYLLEHATVTTLRESFRKWFKRYNDLRSHETLDNLTPTAIYQTALTIQKDTPDQAILVTV